MCDQQQLNDILAKTYRFSVEQFRDKLLSVILFGSYARGDYDEESDIDIMILVDMDAQALTPYEYAFDHFGTKLDLTYDVLTSFALQDKTTFDSWKNTSSFYKNILSEGVRFYG
jgi:predicted nucleotidyltransferase